MNHNRRRCGFSLIELMIVIAIMLIILQSRNRYC